MIFRRPLKSLTSSCYLSKAQSDASESTEERRAPSLSALVQYIPFLRNIHSFTHCSHCLSPSTRGATLSSLYYSQVRTCYIWISVVSVLSRWFVRRISGACRKALPVCKETVQTFIQGTWKQRPHFSIQALNTAPAAVILFTSHEPIRPDLLGINHINDASLECKHSFDTSTRLELQI